MKIVFEFVNDIDETKVNGKLLQLSRDLEDFGKIINEHKSFFIIPFKDAISDLHISIKGIRIEQTFNVKDLGVRYNQDMRFESHMEKFAKQFVSRCIQISTIIKTDRLKCFLFKMYARPVVDFCSAVWNPESQVFAKKFARSQKRFRRRLSSV